MSEEQILKRLELLLVNNHCRISFNYDHQDGYFCEICKIYSMANIPILADLKSGTKRETLLEAIKAAIEFLEA